MDESLTTDSGFVEKDDQDYSSDSSDQEYFDAKEYLSSEESNLSEDESPHINECPTNYREPKLRDSDSRRYVSNKPSLTGALQTLRRWGCLSEEAAPYGRDIVRRSLYGPAPYEQDNRLWDKQDLNAKWQMQYLNDLGYQFVGTIGSGGFAQVWEVSQNNMNRRMACKVLQLKRFRGLRNLNEGVNHILNELILLRKLRHPNILPINGVVHIPDKKSDFPSLFVFMFMELCEGSLMGLINRWKRLDETEAHNWFCQISSALKYLYDNHVFHRDIKPHNILYNRILNRFEYKLCDFGISESLETKQSNSERWETPLYKAPELCGPKKALLMSTLQWREDYDNEVCDVYSLGITLGHSLIGHLFPSNTSAHHWILESLVSTRRYDSRDPLIDILLQTTQKDPKKRFSIKQVIRHNWVQNFNQM